MGYVANTDSRESWQTISVPLDFPLTDGGFIQNMLLDTYENPSSGKKEIFASKRYGLQTTKALTSVSALADATEDGNKGIFAWLKNTTIYSVYGTNIISYNYNSTSESLLSSTFTNPALPNFGNFTEYFDGTNYFLALRKTNVGSKAYTIDTLNTLTQITSVNYPSATAIGSFVSMDGYLFVMTTDGKIYNSDLGAPTKWTATSFATCNISPDGGIGLAKYKNQIVAFGPDSIEFFYNAGNALGSPLSRNEQAIINSIGCLDSKTIISLQDTIFWASKEGIFVLDGFKPVKISTPMIDNFISSTPSYQLYSGSVSLYGKNYYYISATGGAPIGFYTFLYDITLKKWILWSSTIDGTNTWAFTTLNSLGGSVSPSSVVISSNGIPLTYFLSRMADTTIRIQAIANVTDDSSTETLYPIASLIRTRELDFNTHNKVRLHRVSIKYRNGGTPRAGITSGLMASSTEKSFSVNNLGLYKNVRLELNQTLATSPTIGSWNLVLYYQLNGNTKTVPLFTPTADFVTIREIKMYYSICEN